jgi:hypothetical protein
LASLIHLKAVPDAATEMQALVHAEICRSRNPIVSSSKNDAAEVVNDIGSRLLDTFLKNGKNEPYGALRKALIPFMNSSKHALPVTAVMTNPPFYGQDETILDNPQTICTGTDLEMRTCGGELAFIGAIVMDSYVLKDKIAWYTSLVGKKSSLKWLLNLLGKLRVSNVRTVRFLGGKTVRWGIAWSYTTLGEHLLTREGRSPDPRVTDIGSLSSCFQFERRLKFTKEGILTTATSDEMSNLDTSPTVIDMISYRVKKVFNSGMAHVPLQWKLESDKSQTVIEANGMRKNDADILEMKATILIADDEIEYKCTCATVHLQGSMSCIFEAIVKEIQRNNRKWRRKFQKT